MSILRQPRTDLACRSLTPTALALLSLPFAAASALGDCSLTSTGKTPLNDLGNREYKGFLGGLYPDGQSVRPAAHAAAGIELGSRIRPLNGAGNPDPQGGTIVLLSIGMSNTESEFKMFKSRADADPAKNPQLTILNGAQGGKAAEEWLNPDAESWDFVASSLAGQALTQRQVQAAWVKLADGSPTFQHGAFPIHAQVMEGYLERIVHNLAAKFPNLKIVYFSSRIRAYVDDPRALNPEPDAYEEGFSFKWLIERQIEGDPSLNYDPERGEVRSPYLCWGPYLWADGTVPRSDGFTWLCSDLDQADLVHPGPGARSKVAEQLLAFMKTDPTARSWFLRAPDQGREPSVEATAEPTSGPAPLTVDFAAEASAPGGPVAEYAWTFGEGCFSFEARPTKMFTTPGTYETTLTVKDEDGNSASRTVTVIVGSGQSSPSFRRGDANNDNTLDISDAIWVLNWMFQGGGTPPCRDAADANDDGGNDIADAVRILIYFFAPDGQVGFPPLGACGPDETIDALPCGQSRCPA